MKKRFYDNLNVDVTVVFGEQATTCRRNYEELQDNIANGQFPFLSYFYKIKSAKLGKTKATIEVEVPQKP